MIEGNGADRVVLQMESQKSEVVGAQSIAPVQKLEEADASRGEAPSPCSLHQANQAKLVLNCQTVALKIEATSKERALTFYLLLKAVLEAMKTDDENQVVRLPDCELMALALDIAADNLNAKTGLSKKFILDNLRSRAVECMGHSEPEEVQLIVDRIVNLFQIEPGTGEG
jgi:hypothetical protein